jgi:hypothetical protein
MANYALFVPECWADTALMLALLHDRDDFISHAQGIGKVGGVLRRQGADASGQARRVVGLVDGDKKFAEQPYLSEFTEVVAGGWDKSQHPHCILRHPGRPAHHLIVLHPACDAWLLRAAQAIGLDLVALGLPTDLAAFKDFCKQDGVTENKALQTLLRALQRDRPPAYQELADFVSQVMNIAPPRHP